MTGTRAASPPKDVFQGHPFLGFQRQPHPGGSEPFGTDIRWLDAGSTLSIYADARLDGRSSLAAALDLTAPAAEALTDSQLILAAYARWGEDCPRRLLGDYAFAIRDERKGTVFCARDHIGARPFFYVLDETRFAFAGDIETLLDRTGISAELDEDAVAYGLSVFASLPADRTFLKHVRRLAPGHSLTLTAGNARIRRYWSPEAVPEVRLKDDDAYRDAFLDLHRRAVDDRLASEGRIGVHVSGGLDCSGIAAAAARTLRARGAPPPFGFSWQSRADEGAPLEGERAWIDTVGRETGIEVFSAQATPEDLVALFQRDWARGPDVGNLLHEDAIQRRAGSLGVRVMLSGWGGDEAASFNGRGYYPQLLRQGRLGALARQGRAHGRSLPHFALSHGLLPLLSALLPASRGPQNSLINPAFLHRTRPPAPPPIRTTSIRRAQMDLLNDGHITQRLEDWAVNGRRHGIEYRYPLLDRRIMEFAYGLPPEQFRRGSWNRWLMRNAMATLLPAEIAWNPSKDEPQRIEELNPALLAAMSAIGGMLDRRPHPPTRAGFVDMQDLRRRLDDPWEDGRVRLWPIRTALQMLDF